MPNQVRSEGLGRHAELPESENRAARDDIDLEYGSDSHANASSQSIPRWRKIEIMKERAALREALGDDDLDMAALEEEVFGTDEENESLYRHGEEEEESEAFEDDDFDDDEYESFEDD